MMQMVGSGLGQWWRRGSPWSGSAAGGSCGLAARDGKAETNSKLH